MCDSLDEGGRRCPCDAPEARAARRRAKNAAGEAPEGGIGAGGAASAGVGEDTPVASPSLLEAWDSDRAAMLATQIDRIDDQRLTRMSTRTGYRFLSREEHARYADDYDADYNARYAQVHDVMDQTGENTKEGMVRFLGAAVAAEAERRAGVSIEGMQADKERIREEADAEADQALGDHKDAYRSPEWQDVKKARSAYHDLFFSKRRGRQYELERSAAMAHWKQTQQAFAQKYGIADMDAFNDAASNADRATNRRVNAIDGTAGERLAALSRAYQEVLAETRALGGQVQNFTETSKKAARDAVNDAAQVYPADWVRASEAGKPMLARVSKRRAHYRQNHVEKRSVRGQQEQLHLRYGGDRKVPKDTVTRTYEAVTLEDVAEDRYVRARGIIRGEDGVVRNSDGEEVTLHRSRTWESSYQPVVRDERTGKPTNSPGKGWEPYPNEEDGTEVWRRPYITTTDTKYNSVSELTINPVGSLAGRGAHFEVTAHELGHRFEHTVPGITALEEDFLARRTTDPETGEREPLANLYGTSKEQARADGFATAYIGKEYKNSPYREVLSMGVESLFSGSQGGLVGAGHYRADPDMRAFVLGVMATVGREGRQD